MIACGKRMLHRQRSGVCKKGRRGVGHFERHRRREDQGRGTVLGSKTGKTSTTLPSSTSSRLEKGANAGSDY